MSNIAKKSVLYKRVKAFKRRSCPAASKMKKAELVMFMRQEDIDVTKGPRVRFADDASRIRRYNLSEEEKVEKRKSSAAVRKKAKKNKERRGREWGRSVRYYTHEPHNIRRSSDPNRSEKRKAMILTANKELGLKTTDRNKIVEMRKRRKLARNKSLAKVKSKRKLRSKRSNIL